MLYEKIQLDENEADEEKWYSEIEIYEKNILARRY